MCCLELWQQSCQAGAILFLLHCVWSCLCELAKRNVWSVAGLLLFKPPDEEAFQSDHRTQMLRMEEPHSKGLAPEGSLSTLGILKSFSLLRRSAITSRYHPPVSIADFFFFCSLSCYAMMGLCDVTITIQKLNTFHFTELCLNVRGIQLQMMGH